MPEPLQFLIDVFCGPLYIDDGDLSFVISHKSMKRAEIFKLFDEMYISG